MDTQTKVIIGAVVGAALLGFWWSEKKKKEAAAAASAPSMPSAPAVPSMGSGTPPSYASPTAPSSPLASPTPTNPATAPFDPAAQAPYSAASYSSAPLPPMTQAVPPAIARASLMNRPAATFTPAQPAASASEVQSLLNQIGSQPPVRMTGVYDAATVAAVQAFQARMQLPVTGFVDDKTISYLRTMAQASTLPGGG